MSDKYLYLSMIPEGLVASMLPPKEFGTYMAVGTHKRSRGEAMFLDLKEDFQSDVFDLSRVETDCVPHEDGSPKHSLYLGIYRVLEHVPLEAINNLFLVTRDGRVLELAQGSVPDTFDGNYHLYEEYCPVTPMVASSLDPRAFNAFITDPKNPIHLPRICFVEIDFPDLSNEPDKGWGGGSSVHPMLDHMRDCLLQLHDGEKKVKTVDRMHAVGGWAGRIKNGFFVGDQTGLLYYPFPSDEELDRNHHEWYRSASL